MAKESIILGLKNLFRSWSGSSPQSIHELAGAGSYRRYFRITGNGQRVIGAHNPDPSDNRAFHALTAHFREHSLPVPEVYAKDDPKGICLLQDLGDISLFNLILRQQKEDDDNGQIRDLLKQALYDLTQFQIKAGKSVDFSVCHPRPAFDRQSILWDLQYFKYYFLKLKKIPFDEQNLEDDFERFAGFLLDAESDYFMYRDFQSRNIMVHEGKLWYIDYQGGRRGPLQYDLVSFLFQARAAFSPSLRSELIRHYTGCLKDAPDFDEKSFFHYLDGFILVRMLQVLGAYGFRGYYERKAHFIESIPYAVDNIRWFLNERKLPAPMQQLEACLHRIVNDRELSGKQASEPSSLVVTVRSFSYKHGIPRDATVHGGGFVFDCRALPNPGREEKYRDLTGLDTGVEQYLSEKKEVHEFMNNAEKLVTGSAEEYVKRGFTSLSVAFGCTGGQHRSVFCAEWLGRRLGKREDIEVIVKHTMVTGMTD